MFQMMAACNETMIIYDQLYDIINAEAATQPCSMKKVFWKYAANLQGITHVEVWFQWNCLANLLKSHFGMGVLL